MNTLPGHRPTIGSGLPERNGLSRTGLQEPQDYEGVDADILHIWWLFPPQWNDDLRWGLARFLVEYEPPEGGMAYFVHPDGSGDFPTIQDAINQSADGDSVLLGDGVFQGAGNRDLDLQGKRIVVRSISGDPATCSIDCQGQAGSPHRGFYFHSGEGITTRIEGITVRNGYDNGTFNTGGGGGIRFERSSATVKNCVFDGNEAEWTGGSIALYGGSKPIFVSCLFLNSTQGALHADSSPATFLRCSFLENSGEIHLWVSDVLFAYCTFAGNSGVTVSALYSEHGYPQIFNSIFAFGSGAPLGCNGGDIQIQCSNIFGNSGSDWTDCVSSDFGQNGNFSADPLFCDWESGSLSLLPESPCLPGQHPDGSGCDLIGAFGAGCAGACCFGGLCTVLDQTECVANGGVFVGYSVSCDPNPCLGACCFNDGTCLIRSSPSCGNAGGEYSGNQTSCTPNPCPQPGGCCFFDGGCEVVLEAECELAEGQYLGEGVPCDPETCIGACCLDDGSCTLLPGIECVGPFHGTFRGIGASCDPNPCEQPQACCFDDGTCGLRTQSVCDEEIGTYFGGPCTPTPCPPAGACCAWEGSCYFLTSEACNDRAGEYLGDGVVCNPEACPILGACCFTTICFLVDEFTCLKNGGEFLGERVRCEPSACTSIGACCSDQGECIVTSLNVCDQSGGTWLRGKDCLPNLCTNPPGVCCLADGSCQVVPGLTCASLDGVFLEGLDSCEPDPCSAVGIPPELLDISAISISRPMPNPTSTRISFQIALPGAKRVDVRVLDGSGKLVRQLMSEEMRAGLSAVEWDLDGNDRRVPSGVYYVAVEIDGKRQSERVVVVR